jgi:hypothetical protein
MKPLQERMQHHEKTVKCLIIQDLQDKTKQWILFILQILFRGKSH